MVLHHGICTDASTCNPSLACCLINMAAACTGGLIYQDITYKYNQVKFPRDRDFLVPS